MKLQTIKESVSNGVKRVENLAIDSACAVAGGVHFVASSVADVAMEAEARMRLKQSGLDKEQTKKERVFKTLEKQVIIEEKFNVVKERLNYAKQYLFAKRVAKDHRIETQAIVK